MFRFSILISSFTLLLVACSNQSPPTDSPVASPESAMVDELTPSDTPQETVGLADPNLTEGLETFKIIPIESEVTYEVGEVFLNQNNRFNVAVGVTPEVSGEILVDRNNPQNSTIGLISVDISQFKSDSGMRDNAIRERFLESAKFPTVTFLPTDLQGLPESYEEGQSLVFQITGDATIRDITLPVTFDVTLVGEGDTLTGEAKAVILMSDFGFGPISIGGILNTEDEVNLIFTYVARP
jgi:polyisoprenoid-binding protein YceI